MSDDRMLREDSIERDFWEGYCDGRDPSSPEPSDNRSACYRHSFEVGRAEIAGNPIPAALSRERAAEAERIERLKKEDR